ncbi:hypothetical protein [Devosia sp.]|uniref:hypothetical protein n=1 Tax=Devosia sp. TaxID=1871048 RepID=UPI0019E3B7C3|nr:hypothetical protein [Devosia sp.]MBE0580995.1 hypothetical protein [Devosia sp.]
MALFVVVPKVTLDIPAYMAATAVGSVVMALLWSVISGLNLQGPGAILIVFFGLIFSLPTMLFMMPVTFAGIYLANRFGWRQRRQFFIFGAVAPLVTAAAMLPFLRPSYDLAGLWLAAPALALSGGLAGLTYRSTLGRYRPGGTTLT